MKNISILTKIFLLTFISVLASAIIVGAIGITIYYNDAIETNADKAVTIAEALAAGVDGDAVEEMLGSGQMNDEYAWISDFLYDAFDRIDLQYIYVLDKVYDSNVRYFIDVCDDEPVPFGELEEIENHADEYFQVADGDGAVASAIYDSGEYGNMLSGFAPIYTSSGALVAVMGVDINVDHIYRMATDFALTILLFIGIMCVVFGIASWLITNKLVGRLVGAPIQQLTAASEKLAVGDIDIVCNVDGKDEIGRLGHSFSMMVDGIRNQISAMERISHGDLSVRVYPRSDNDVMNIAIQDTVTNLRNVIEQIQTAAEQLAGAAQQISLTSQSLSDGTLSQNASVQELSAAMVEISGQSRESVHLASDAAKMIEGVQHQMETSADQMQRLNTSVQEIYNASNEITKIVKAIDDIASQTNLLSLNASVEAARAGEHGKGFSVVASEVRALAAKSSEAASETGRMLSDIMEKSGAGLKAANETSEALRRITEGVAESVRVIGKIPEVSHQQDSSIVMINDGISHVSNVTLQSSASAEESASASVQLSEQAASLEDLVKGFVL